MKDLLRFFPNMAVVSCIALLSLGANLFLVHNVLELNDQKLVLELERTALEKDKENYKEFRAEVCVLAKELLEKSARLSEVKDTLTKEQNRLDAVTAEYDATMSGTRQLQQDASNAEKRLKEARLLEKALAPKIRTLEADRNRLEASIAALQEHQSELEKRKAGLEQEASTQNRALDALRAELGRLEGQLQAKQTALAELDKENRAFDRLSKNMADLLKNLGDDRASASALIADMEKALDDIRQRNAALAETFGGELAGVAARMRIRAEELENDRSDVKKASDSLNTTTSELASLASSLEAQKARIDESIANLEKVNGLLDDDRGLVATQALLTRVNAQLGDLLASVERERDAGADKAPAQGVESAPEQPVDDAGDR